MQRDAIMQAALVTVVSVPGFFIGRLLSEGRDVQALQVALANVLMILIAGAIMYLRRRDKEPPS